MRKGSQIAQIAVFLLVLFAVPVLYLILPDRDVSETENRTLAQKPAFSWQALLSGSYTADVDRWLTDQMPGRDEWIALYGYAEALLGKTENNGVYIGEKGTLIARFEAPDADRVKKNRAALEALVQKAGVPVYLALIPGAVEVWSDRLPAGAPNASQAELIADICAGTAARTVDVLGALTAHQDEDIYYRTDHHWTTLGAYYGYAALIRALGGEPAPAESFDRQIVSNAFYGTNYAKAGARWIRPDAIERWVAGDGATVLLDGTAPAALYAPDKLETRDKYAYFLGGNRGLSVVRTGHEGGKLLLLRDSYSDSEAPFLLTHYGEIHLIDPRYYNGSILEYIGRQGIDAVVVNMSVDTFTGERSTALIGY